MLRAVITFATGILIARELGPSEYGEITFLLGSFIAIRALLDMGSSSAFYTFISRQPRSNRFFRIYLNWLGLQFLISLALVSLIIPSGLFEKIWLGQFRGTVALAFMATFIQQQIWPMIGQIGESARKTIQVQLLNIAVACIYLAVIWLLFRFDNISVLNVLWALISVYGIAAILGYRLLRPKTAENLPESKSFQQILNEYWIYCKPMLGLAVAGFIYSFADKWMLQRFGGATQQGFFQIASQFAQISLLATVSILNIFWKEVSEARAKGDYGRVSVLYKKINRSLVILSAAIAGLLFPWSKQIIAVLLGPIREAWQYLLSVSVSYPSVHRANCGTMFMAVETPKYVSSISLMRLHCQYLTSL